MDYPPPTAQSWSGARATNSWSAFHRPRATTGPHPQLPLRYRRVQSLKLVLTHREAEASSGEAWFPRRAHARNAPGDGVWRQRHEVPTTLAKPNGAGASLKQAARQHRIDDLLTTTPPNSTAIEARLLGDKATPSPTVFTNDQIIHQLRSILGITSIHMLRMFGTWNCSCEYQKTTLNGVTSFKGGSRARTTIYHRFAWMYDGLILVRPVPASPTSAPRCSNFRPTSTRSRSGSFEIVAA